MKINKKISGLSALIFCSVIILFIKPVYGTIITTGMKADIDLSDILYPGRKLTDEIEIKKLCIEITDRYHNKGYTAFKIKKSILNEDGSVELLFSDPVVENVFVSGTDTYNESIAGEIFKKNEPFNEFLLNDNIAVIKKEYSIRKIKVDIKRNSNDNIDIFVSPEKRILNGIITASSDTVYGGITFISLSFASGTDRTTVDFESTAGMREASYTKAGINYISITTWGNLISFLLGIEYEDKKAYIEYPENISYNTRIIQGETGLLLNKGAAVFSFTAVSSYTDYHHYRDIENNYYFHGISAAVKYNDKDYKLDSLDIMTAEIKSEYLWNPVEKNMEIRVIMNGYLTLPVSEFCSLAALFDLNYTTEDEIIFHQYVFDRTLPVRNKDYSIAKWRYTGRPGLLFDIYNRLIFLSTEYYISAYDNQGENEPIQAASVRGLIKSDIFSSEIAYAVEIGKALKEGVLTFEVKAMF